MAGNVPLSPNIIVRVGSVLLALISHYVCNRREPSVAEFTSFVSLLEFALSWLWYSKEYLTEEPLLRLMLQCNLYYFFTLALSLALYRLFFHPLRKYPGPVLGKLSKFYFSYIALSGNTHIWLEDLHHKYGDVVRYGPNELSFIDPEDVTFIHGAKSFRIRRGPWYDGNPGRKGHGTLVMASTRNVDSHKFRRKIWDKAFTLAALTSYEPRLTRLVDRLVQKYEESDGKVVDISRGIDNFAFDAMGEMSFSEDFGMISGTSVESQQWMRMLQDYMRMLSIIRPVPWFKNLYRILPIDTKGKEGGLGFVKFTIKRFERRYEKGADAGDDIAKYLLLPDQKTGLGLTKSQAAEESVVVVVAGSDTTSVALTFALYYLLVNREACKKLQLEVDSIWNGHSTLDGQKLAPAHAPYLNAVINEALRLAEPDPNGNQRSTPKGGFMVNDKYVPEFTQLSIHKWSMQRNERNFTKAHEFIPERWVSDEERKDLQLTNHNTKGFIPFGAGQYGCVGKPLALLEMRLFLVRFMRRLEFSSSPDFDLQRFPKETISNLTLLKGSLPVLVKKRNL